MNHHCAVIESLKWLADAILALATTGMRIGELIAMRWTDIDLASGAITVPDNRHGGLRRKRGKTVRTTKGGRSRRIPIHPNFAPSWRT